MKDKIILAINLYCDNKIPKEALHAFLVEYGLSNNQLEIIAPACVQITFSIFKGIVESDLEFIEESINQSYGKYYLAKVLHFNINKFQRFFAHYLY